MQFLTSLFGGSENMVLNAVLALGFVIVLIVLGVWLLKVLSNASRNVGKPRQRRIVIVDQVQVDQRRQILLIRRDNVEHLVMTGGPQDVVIESDIAVEAGRAVSRRPAPAQSTPQTARVTRPAEPANDSDAAIPAEPELPAPAEARRPASLRHTGLLRRRVDPVVPDKSDNAAADSDIQGRVEALKSRRNGDGQGMGGEVSSSIREERRG